ncbi:hypothetical protein PUN28_013405 [Cardiocondyla obscurior]|uniref:Uncharacterized protein n=1 Tax=Cardiocondyla obscurior TaxID=286306 RepID=A0AAW2FB73_9HYME
MWKEKTGRQHMCNVRGVSWLRSRPSVRPLVCGKESVIATSSDAAVVCMPGSRYALRPPPSPLPPLPKSSRHFIVTSDALTRNAGELRMTSLNDLPDLFLADYCLADYWPAYRCTGARAESRG